MRIQVQSEVGRLQTVLLHQPGNEIVRMTQHDFGRMLFDDILSPSEAAREHAMMADIMTAAGARVLALHDLLVEALHAAPTAAREAMLERCCSRSGEPSIATVLATREPHAVARALVEGVSWSSIRSEHQALSDLVNGLRTAAPDALAPLPNMMFLRDPCIATFDRVVQGRMATQARSREPELVAFALKYAPSVAAELSFEVRDALGEAYHRIEGGDVLVLSPEVLMIGCSERTDAATIERLARENLFELHPQLQRIYVVVMPVARSVMHLDTILTQVDRTVFLGHAPLIAGTPGTHGLRTVLLGRTSAPTLLANAAPLDVLREEFGAQTVLVPCGGDDPLHQEREQWTDGANAVALGPGAVMLYARNRKTVDALAAHGLCELHLPLEEPADARQQRVSEAMQSSSRQPVVFTFTGSELSRARGGGRCLTMPLHRTDLDGNRS